jgi:pre-rRNA-processing protein TSR4
LPLQNEFYQDAPPDETLKLDEIKPVSLKLCQVCGCKGPMVCAKCKNAQYCGAHHQKLDWKMHKKSCGQAKNDANQIKVRHDILFPQFEIDIEREENIESDKESEKDAEKRRLREYEEMVKSGKAGNGEISEKDLQDIAETKEDKIFGKFKEAIENYPDQVLRYCRNGKPLWISDFAMLDNSNIPKCINCGGRRTFEFQIMPQMLNELKEYSLDWGVIAIYTCENDCDIDGKYVLEFCYKQDVVKGEFDGDVDIDMKQASLKKNSVAEILPTDQNGGIEYPISSSKTQSKSKKIPNNPQLSTKKKSAFEESDNWE